MKMDIELREGELICSSCKGVGHDKDEVYVCKKCDGIGKVDWVSNAMLRKRRMTSMNRVNIRRLVLHIQKMVEDSVSNFDVIETTYEKLEDRLDSLLTKRAIDDYKITRDQIKNTERIDISIKPTRTVEIINLNFVIKTTEQIS
jgi:hypothetical protein